MSEERQEFLIALGANIKKIREEKGLSQEELARKCGYKSDSSRSTIQKIESGVNDVPASKLKKIADALDTSVTSLMNSSVQMQKEKKACELFEQCYGKEAFETVSGFLQLDAHDRGYIKGSIKTLLEQEKYRKKESKNA